MKKLVPLLILGLAAASGWATAPWQGATPTESSAPPPAAKPVSNEAGSLHEPPAKRKPLLLDDEPEPPKPGDKPTADNSRCYVCHVNYEKEEMAVVHARAGIGCAKCHGASDAHIADESWASGGKGTPPTVMYPPDKVNKACQTCHKADRNKPDRKCPFPAKGNKKICTDCHGKHRLHARKCKW
ncbi:MAG: multiheme c-type cytochrome [Pirellulales bacterium]